MNIKESIESVRNGGFFQQWMPALQRLAIQQALKGEEKRHFAEVLTIARERIEGMPKTYEQDGLGDQAVVYLHYFINGTDAWITEKDMGDSIDIRQYQAFGKVTLTGDKNDAELGYISIEELIQNGVEFDLYWAKKTLAEVLA